jgi:cytochrome P450
MAWRSSNRRLRRIIASRFSLPAADRWRPVMRAILEQLWTDLAQVTSAEFVSLLANPAGTIVAICVERANREGEDGDSFDITADREGRLLTFGAGPHFCLGANLAKAERQEALGFLVDRMPGLSLDGSPAFACIEGIYGVETLPPSWQRTDR